METPQLPEELSPSNQSDSQKKLFPSRTSLSLNENGELEFFDRIGGRWVSVRDALFVVPEFKDA